ncbi:MAG: hypothetical protein Kow00124_10270 [Anaerolineae bacterium]
MSKRARRLVVCILTALMAALSGCSALPLAQLETPEAGADPTTTREPVIPTPEVEQAESAVPIPTEAVRTFITYRHPSGVFALNIPLDWEVVDETTEQQIRARFMPPPGYGSRLLVEVTHEGPQPPDAVRQMAEGYILLNYASTPAYQEIERDELPDGRLRYMFRYSDGMGGAGLETLVIQQIGPYFTALRLFLSDTDTYTLSAALEAAAASFSADPLALWGVPVAAINPAELLIANTALWQTGTLTYYTGELINASPSTISGVQIRVAFCNSAGIVLAEVLQPVALDYVARGASSPFAIQVENLGRDVRICIEQGSAQPAAPDPNYFTAFGLDMSLQTTRSGELIARGRLINPALSPASDIEIVITIYDADGRVIGVGRVVFGPTLLLPPGAAQEFAYTFDTLGGDAERYQAVAQGRLIDLTRASLLPTPTP